MAEIYKKEGFPNFSNISEEIKEIDRELEELIKKQSTTPFQIGGLNNENKLLSRDGFSLYRSI